MDFARIEEYFPETNGQTLDKLGRLEKLYATWNAQINLISRNDFEHFWERHVLYSLALIPIFQFQDGSRVIDVGTGGGFPGIPLSIFFPKVDFVLNDSIGKKLKVAEDVANQLGLDNVKTAWGRSEDIDETFDYVTGRGVKSIPEFCKFSKHLLSYKKHVAIWYWKGGDFMEELTQAPFKSMVYNISDYFSEPFFETKKIIKLYNK